MRGRPVNNLEIQQIIKLRQTGHSIPEIRKALNRGSSTICKYIQNIQVLPEYVALLRTKQGGSRERSNRQWEEAREIAKIHIPTLSKREKAIILSCLYWAEGTKKEFNIINSDPFLLVAFVSCLKEIGVSKEELKITLRIYGDLKPAQAISYWSKVLDVKPTQIANVNILEGKKEGKLPYGMCRIRIKKGAMRFKVVLSMIDLIKLHCSPRSSTDRTSHS